MVEKFQAFIVDQDDKGNVSHDFKKISKQDLPEGDVLIKVHYSGINYKDALATQDNNAIVKVILWCLVLIWLVLLKKRMHRIRSWR